MLTLLYTLLMYWPLYYVHYVKCIFMHVVYTYDVLRGSVPSASKVVCRGRVSASLLCVVWAQCVRHQPLSPCSSSRFEYDCTDCTAFWKCDRGRWINAQCVPGTAFHPTLNTCVDRSTVPSCWGQYTAL